MEIVLTYEVLCGPVHPYLCMYSMAKIGDNSRNIFSVVWRRGGGGCGETNGKHQVIFFKKSLNNGIYQSV